MVINGYDDKFTNGVKLVLAKNLAQHTANKT